MIRLKIKIRKQIWNLGLVIEADGHIQGDLGPAVAIAETIFHLDHSMETNLN